MIPAYEEEQGIAATVTVLREWLAERGGGWELIVVDNASRDGTVARLEPLLDERVRLLRNDANRGKGHSVRRGMLAATGELRLHCDADCAVSLPSLPGMVDQIADADLVVGSRLAEGARVGRRQPPLRRALGRSFVGLCRAALAEPTTDLFCGFKLWRAEAVETVFPRVSLDGWTFDAEAIALARALGFRVRETGIVWEDRDGSRLSMPRVLLPVVGELLRARRNVRAQSARTAPRSDALAANSTL